MQPEVPWLSRKLSQSECTERSAITTYQSLQSLTSDPAFSRWLDEKRENLALRKRQEESRKDRARWRSYVFFAVLLLVSAGLISRHCPGLFRLPTLHNGTVRALNQRLHSITYQAGPALERANPRPQIEAAAAGLQPVYQHLASQMAAGITQLSSLVPHAAKRAASEAASPAASRADVTGLDKLPQSDSKAILGSSLAAGPSSSESRAAMAPASAATEHDLLGDITGIPPEKAKALAKLYVRAVGHAVGQVPKQFVRGMQEAARTVPQEVVRGMRIAAKEVPRQFAQGLREIARQTQLALPSCPSNPWRAAHVPQSVIAESACQDQTGFIAQDAHNSSTAAPALQSLTEEESSSPPASSTSLALYIAKMPIRTAARMGTFASERLMTSRRSFLPSLPFRAKSLPPSVDLASQLKSLSPVSLPPASSAAASAAEGPVADTLKAEPAPATGLLARLNKSSKPLANLAPGLPSKASEGTDASTRQRLLALPGPGPSPIHSAVHSTVQSAPPAAHPPSGVIAGSETTGTETFPTEAPGQADAAGEPGLLSMPSEAAAAGGLSAATAETQITTAVGSVNATAAPGASDVGWRKGPSPWKRRAALFFQIFGVVMFVGGLLGAIIELCERIYLSRTGQPMHAPKQGENATADPDAPVQSGSAANPRKRSRQCPKDAALSSSAFMPAACSDQSAQTSPEKPSKASESGTCASRADSSSNAPLAELAAITQDVGRSSSSSPHAADSSALADGADASVDHAASDARAYARGRKQDLIGLIEILKSDVARIPHEEAINSFEDLMPKADSHEDASSSDQDASDQDECAIIQAVSDADDHVKGVASVHQPSTDAATTVSGAGQASALKASSQSGTACGGSDAARESILPLQKDTEACSDTDHSSATCEVDGFVVI